MIRQVAKRIANIRFDRPCSFSSQTFVCFADHPFKVFRFMQKNWFYYYEEDEVRFEKLEKELGKNIVRKITLLIQKGYLKNLKPDLESGSIEIIASNKQVEDQIYEIKICPHCGAKKRTVKGRVCRCDFCDQII